MGTWTKVRSIIEDSGYTSVSSFSPYVVNAPANLPVGDLLILTFQYGAASDQQSIISGTDNAPVPNTYTKEAHAFDGTHQQGAIRLSTIITSQIVTGDLIKAQWTGGGGFIFVTLLVEQWHYSTGTPAGISGTPAGQFQSAPGTGTDAITSGTTTPTADGCLIHGSLIYTGSLPGSTTAGTGFTTSVDDLMAAQVITEQFTQTTHAAVAATWTQTATAQPTIALVAAYAPPGGGGGGRLFRGADLDGLGGIGTKRFNPSL